MKSLITIILVFPFIAVAQKDINYRGIHFEHGLNWEQLKSKALTEHKFIFVDCYTTWCLPCKQMEKNVFTKENIGVFFNENFVSVQIQMNKTNNDNADIKSWYVTADDIQSKYEVNVYPTFLFFSPNGKIVHRAAGGFSINDFLALGKNALDSNKQYYSLLAKYDPGNMDTGQLKALALSYRFNGPELAGKIVEDYIKRIDKKDLVKEETLRFLEQFINVPSVKEIADSIINSFKGNEFYTKDNIKFMSFFTQKSSDKGFEIFLKYSDKVDSAYNERYFSAKGFVANIMVAEEIQPMLDKAEKSKSEPEWKKLREKIRKKYGEYFATRCIMEGKSNWYHMQKNYEAYRKNLIQYVDKFYSDLDDWYLNDFAWSFFVKSNNVSELKEALSWSEKAVEMYPTANWMDTYANLLYKLGNRSQAILWEQVAIKLEPTRNQQFILNLEKMQRNEPTWPASERQQKQ
jgi:thioredoxin-related protein